MKNQSTITFDFANPFFSLIAFSIYSGIMGIVLLAAPRTLLPLFGVHEPVSSWTFMLGFVLLCSTFYYCASAFAGSRHFALLTVITRFAAPLVCGILYLKGDVPVNFVLLSIVDATGGLWTLACLRRR